MAITINLESLLAGCADDSFDDGIRIDTELEPLSGPGGRVKPAVYEGGTYQMDRRWAAPADEAPTPVIVIDNVPSQANRLEEALRRHRESIKVPELVLDLSDIGKSPGPLAAPALQPGVPAPQRRRLSAGCPARRGRFHEDRSGSSDLRGHPSGVRPTDGVVPTGAAVRILAIAPGKETAEHQACPLLGIGNRRLEPGSDRHQGARAEG